MKKLLLIAATLCLAVACADSGSNGDKPTPPTPPTPTGDPAINLTSIDKKATVDTSLLIIENYTGELKVGRSDPNFGFNIVKKDANTYVITGVTAGECILVIDLGGKQFSIDCKFAPSVTEIMYSEALRPYGKTLDDVKGLETARGNEYKNETWEGTNLFVEFTAKATLIVGAVSESYTYVFPRVGVDGVGNCIQSTIYTYYGKDVAIDQPKAMAAQTRTTENNYYAGFYDDKEQLLVAKSFDGTYITIYMGAKYTTGEYGFIAHYLEYKEDEEAPRSAAVRSIAEPTFALPSVGNVYSNVNYTPAK